MKPSEPEYQPEKFNENVFSSPTFCFYPFLQISTVPAGFTKPCCYFDDVIRGEENVKMRVDQHEFEKIWKSEYLQSIRLKMAKGEKVKGCSQCYREESFGQSSMRLRSFQDWQHKDYIREQVLDTLNGVSTAPKFPKILELKPGNQCNLKCRMCNKFDSNQIGLELDELAKKHSWIKPWRLDRLKSWLLFDEDFNTQDMTKWSHASDFWKSVRENIPHLERLGFAGGESSLIAEVKQTLQHCVESGFASNINVFYTSNLTKLSDDLIELGKKFRTFTFIASIDGTGSIQEYIRFPSKWADVARNFARLREQVDEDQWRVIANFTVQSYNICHLVDFLRWMETFDRVGHPFVINPVSLNLLTEPKFLDIQFLPVEVRELALGRINEYMKNSRFVRFPDFKSRIEMLVALLQQPAREGFIDRMRDFRDFTEILDEHRGQKLRLVNPFLYQSVRDCIK